MDKITIQQVSSFIEENTRASQTSGITYIDPRSFKSRILLKQNHVIFGRRGAGKSSLIKTLKEDKSTDYYYSYTNLEDLKDVSFPNIIIHILSGFNRDISDQIVRECKFLQFKKKIKARRLKRNIEVTIEDFMKQLSDPDNYDEEIKAKQANASLSKSGVGYEGINMDYQETETNEFETAKKINRDKLESLKNSIPRIKSILKDIEEFAPNKSIFMIFDDFYFLKKQVQVFFIDFFHRLTKDTKLYIKVATIKHRSKLYSQIEGSHFGTEIGHDIHEIDLDYNLDRFDELKSFMRSLIDECATLCKVTFEVDSIFSDGGFTQLCLASGGVPRDFLTLFVKVSNNYDPSSDRRISKTNITEAAIANMTNKTSYLKTDSAEEKEILETYLEFIKDKIIVEKKTNMFLVSNKEIETFPQIKQAIKELVDLRMFHLVDPNTSALGGASGHRYTAYIVDIGLYTNAFQIGFKQLDPGVTDSSGRKDEMRSAPKLILQDVNEYIVEKNMHNRLEITED